MPDEAAERLRTVWEWVRKAEGDLTNAVHTLRLREDCPTETVCFHVQQCVEKYLKAFLTLVSIEFPKTHDVRFLMRLLPPDARPTLTLEEQRVLTTYATASRYPSGAEPTSLVETRRAVAIARRVRREMRRLLPPRAIRRKQP